MAKTWHTRLIPVVAGVLLSIPISEIGLRLFVPQAPSWLAIYRRHPTLPFYAHQPNIDTRIDTGETRWRVCIDAQGFRIPCGASAVDLRPTVLWLGDSFAFGQSVDYEDCFVGRLAAGGTNPDHHVDAAVCGYGPREYRRTLEYLLESAPAPRLVIVQTFLGNDFSDCVWSKDIPVQDGIIGNEGGWKTALKLHSHLYRLVAAKMHQLHSARVEQTSIDREMADPASWTEGQFRQADATYREEFQRIRDLCAARSILLAVLVIPRSTMIVELQNGTAKGIDDPRGSTLPWKHALTSLKDLGLRVLDLTPELVKHPVDETFFPFDGHFTPRGNAWIVDDIRREWSDLLHAP